VVIVEDTRQQAQKHARINDWFAANGIKVVRTSLFVGDYTLLTRQTVCVDTKKDVVELAGNICGPQHARFRRECVRAQENGIRLVVLIEEPVEDLNSWQSPRRKNGKPLTQVKGGTLKKAMATMTEKYGVEFEFCDKSKTGQRILEILGVD
jgi:ERCC4-type nuclease